MKEQSPSNKINWNRIAFVVYVGIMASSHSAMAADTRFEVTPLVGYQFGGEVNLVGGTANLDSSPSVGVMIGYRVRDDAQAIISYQIQPTEVELTLTGMPATKTDLKVGYVQIGGELGGNLSAVNFYFGLTIGATHFSPEGSGSSEWFFSGAAYTGAKIPITKNLAIRGQIRVLGTLIDSNSTWFCTGGGGGGAGCVIKASDFTGTIQGDVSIGLALAF